MSIKTIVLSDTMKLVDNGNHDFNVICSKHGKLQFIPYVLGLLWAHSKVVPICPLCERENEITLKGD